MYIRYESGLRDADSRGYGGLFVAYGTVRHSEALQDCWQMEELHRLHDWFNRNLDRPQRLRWRSRRVTLAGLCWFRAEAAAHIEQARYMAWLLDDLGLAITEWRSRTPGRILWGDQYQIVASALL